MVANNDVKMDRGPVIFTSDVSLPKDDKNASEVKNPYVVPLYTQSNYITIEARLDLGQG